MTDTFDAPTTAIDDITGDYTIDPSHSTLGFVARHAMVTKVRGQFSDFEGTARVDATDPAASRVDLTIDVASIDTRSADRDGHLRSGDFFDAETYPNIRFVSTDVKRTAPTGPSPATSPSRTSPSPSSIDFEETGSAQDPFGNVRVGFEGATTINRKDFGLTWNAALETGGVLVSEKIKLEFDISAIKSA